jgi:hypothetical protein
MPAPTLFVSNVLSGEKRVHVLAVHTFQTPSKSNRNHGPELL